MSEQENSNEKCCEPELAKLEKEAQIIKSELKNKTEQYQKLLIENLKKDVLISELKKEIDDSKYIEFGAFFPSNTLKDLQLIDDVPENDSKFITMALKGVYNDKLVELSKKTLSGRHNKQQITPEKKKIIDELFYTRLKHLPDEEIKKRRSNLSKLIRNTIDHLKK